MSKGKIIKPKFPIGSVVKVPSLEKTGIVMLWKPWAESMYFVDLYPGADSGYEYIYMLHPTERTPYLCPGNWLPEAALEKHRAR